MNDTTKDVHTEHCCIHHGCKYCDENCTVMNQEKEQSFSCEDCEHDSDLAYEQAIDFALYETNDGHTFLKTLREEKWNVVKERFPDFAQKPISSFFLAQERDTWY